VKPFHALAEAFGHTSSIALVLPLPYFERPHEDAGREVHWLPVERDGTAKKKANVITTLTTAISGATGHGAVRKLSAS